MTVTLVIAYEKGASIDQDYYIKTHVPLVAEAWTPYAKRWRVEVPQAGSNCPFELMAIVEWDSITDIHAARAAVTPEKEKEIQDDLAKCSTKKAIFWPMEVKASG